MVAAMMNSPAIQNPSAMNHLLRGTGVGASAFGSPAMSYIIRRADAAEPTAAMALKPTRCQHCLVVHSPRSAP